MASGAWCACRLRPYKTVASGAIRCEVPREWDFLPGGDLLLKARSPDAIHGIFATFGVNPSEVREREGLVGLMLYTQRLYANDPNFSQEELRRIPIAGVDGWLIGWTRSKSGPSFHPPPPPPDGYATVKLREAEIYFTSGGKGYWASFKAPVELFEKYRPAYEHFLTSLKISP